MLLATVWTQINIMEDNAGPRDLDGVEFFSGKAAVSWACINQGLHFDRIDKLTGGPDQDILRSQGFSTTWLVRCVPSVCG